MTGRELIIYILEKGLEDEQVFVNGHLIGFLTMSEAAQKLDVGIESIKVMIEVGAIDTVEGTDFIPEHSIAKYLEKRKAQV